MFIYSIREYIASVYLNATGHRKQHPDSVFFVYCWPTLSKYIHKVVEKQFDGYYKQLFYKNTHRLLFNNTAKYVRVHLLLYETDSGLCSQEV